MNDAQRMYEASARKKRERKARAKALFKHGKPLAEISELVGVSVAKVREYLAEEFADERYW